VEIESTLANLIAEFAPPSRRGRSQSAAYPFTRLRFRRDLAARPRRPGRLRGAADRAAGWREVITMPDR